MQAEHGIGGAGQELATAERDRRAQVGVVGVPVRDHDGQSVHPAAERQDHQRATGIGRVRRVRVVRLQQGCGRSRPAEKASASEQLPAGEAGAGDEGGVVVEFADGETLPAVVLASDPADDLAVLRVSTRAMPAVRPLRLGDSTTVRVGDPTLALGNPFGSERTLSSGIVSALGRGRWIDALVMFIGPAG